ncbi:MAG: hypothetical protein K2K19_05025, partial [Acetatifactor sp.]|nr:hypothetical protein [Acetatifactor sp.]
MEERDGRQAEIRELAAQVLALARDNILVSMRFLDVALMELEWQEKGDIGGVSTDGSTVWY